MQHAQLESQVQLCLRSLVAGGRCKAAPPEAIAGERGAPV